MREDSCQRCHAVQSKPLIRESNILNILSCLHPFSNHYKNMIQEKTVNLKHMKLNIAPVKIKNAISIADKVFFTLTDG